MITLEREELHSMLVEAARIGAEHAIDDMVCYHLKDAADKLGVSYNTLTKRIREGKIRAIDGRVTGQEIRRYLFEHVGKR